MVTVVNEKTYEFFIDSEDMGTDGKPNFTTYNDQPLTNGCLAINIETKKGYYWSERLQKWV